MLLDPRCSVATTVPCNENETYEAPLAAGTLLVGQPQPMTEAPARDDQSRR
ncbi:MAG: hypothetical protein OHK0013_50040 [Sandaracinaceae bacterium]